MNKRQDAKQYLYRLTFPNGMVYIGIAFDVASRWANRGVRYRSQSVYKHIEEFGWENIEKEVLLYIPVEMNGTTTIRRLEQEFIHAYGDRCYNRPQYEIKSFLEVDGVRKPTREWCSVYGIAQVKVMRRMSRWGLTPKQALTFPTVPREYTKRPMDYWREVGCFDAPESSHPTQAE